jgi:hypothetical protein
MVALAGAGDARVPATPRRSRSEAARAVELDVAAAGALCPAARPAAARAHPADLAPLAIPSPALVVVRPVVARRFVPVEVVAHPTTRVHVVQPPPRAPPLAA